MSAVESSGGTPATPTFDASLAADPAVSFAVVYHYPCPDGAMAALCASTALPPARTRWHPLAVYSSPAARAAVAASFTRDTVVFVLDFSGGAPFLAAAAAAARAVVLIDHHKTVHDDLAALGPAPPGNLVPVVDMRRSGCGLAAAYFSAPAALPPGVAGALALVEDNDLWLHQLEGSKEAAAGFAACAGELDANARPGGPPALWAALAALTTDFLKSAGVEELRAQDAAVAADVAAAAPLVVPVGPGGADGAGARAGLRCLGVLTATPQYRSAAGNAVAAAARARGLAAAAAVACDEPGLARGPAGEAMVKVSLRSIGDVDTTPLARSYGGGGHANASSFNVARAAWDAWLAAGAGEPPGAGAGGPGAA